MTAPHGPSQQALLHAAIANADRQAADMTLVALHGTGTPLGDPIGKNSQRRKLFGLSCCFLLSPCANFANAAMDAIY